MMSSDPGPAELLPTTRVGRKESIAADVGNKHVLMNVERGIYVALDAVGKGIWERLNRRAVRGTADDLSGNGSNALRARRHRLHRKSAPARAHRSRAVRRAAGSIDGTSCAQTAKLSARWDVVMQFPGRSYF